MQKYLFGMIPRGQKVPGSNPNWGLSVWSFSPFTHWFLSEMSVCCCVCVFGVLVAGAATDWFSCSEYVPAAFHPQRAGMGSSRNF